MSEEFRESRISPAERQFQIKRQHAIKALCGDAISRTKLSNIGVRSDRDIFLLAIEDTDFFKAIGICERSLKGVSTSAEDRVFLVHLGIVTTEKMAELVRLKNETERAVQEEERIGAESLNELRIKKELAVKVLRDGPSIESQERASLRNQYEVTDPKKILELALRDQGFEKDFLCSMVFHLRNSSITGDQRRLTFYRNQLIKVFNVEDLVEVEGELTKIAGQERNKNLILWDPYI